MKKLITICVVIGILVALSGTAQAGLTYVFNPNNLIDLYNQGPPVKSIQDTT